MPVQTRSQTKAAAMEQNTSNSKAPKKEQKEFIDSKGRHIKLLTEKELKKMGLHPFSGYKGTEYKIVVSARELDNVICLANSELLYGYYALAPDGYYWKEFSKKCYYWFDWYELARIPKKYI